MNIMVIGGSNSTNSINRKFAIYAASLFENSTNTLFDLSKLDLPLYSIQLEEKIGIPKDVEAFAENIDATDLIVLSLAENNGSFNSGFKNIMDWTSRIKGRKIFGNKPMLLLATSPGARGGASVLETAQKLFPFQGAIVKNTFSLPSFNENFDDEIGITNEALLNALKTIIKTI
jgi:chromate reductase